MLVGVPLMKFTTLPNIMGHSTCGSRWRMGDDEFKTQRRTCRAPGLTMLVGVPLMKFTTLSKAAPKYSS